MTSPAAATSKPVMGSTIWTERRFPDGLRSLLEPDDRTLGAWSVAGSDPLLGIEAADAVIASVRVRYDGALLDRAPRLRVIARTGAGLDNVAVEEATQRGIAICNVPDGPTISTAEHTLALMLAVAKRLKTCDNSLRSGAWDIFNDHDAVELDGLTLGIIGLGRIGSRVANVARALGMVVLAWDPFATPEHRALAGVRAAGSLDELLQTSDVITIHAPLTTATAGLVDRRAISLMRPGAIVINAARGGLLDEVALLEALDGGRLGGAGLDVFREEPLPPDSPLLGRDDIVVSPHVAAATVASRERLWRTALEDVLRCLRGESPRNIVNPEVLGVDGAVSVRGTTPTRPMGG